MSEPIIPQKVKLFIGIIFNDESILMVIQNKLIKRFGAIDFQSNNIPFNHTTYYKTMGYELKKGFFSFKRTIKHEEIVKIKLFTNKLEKKTSGKGGRQLNIDPGYLTLSNVFLASCKDYFHRVYLGRGIYLENEYRYVGKQYLPWDWTYPDYRKPEYLFFFHEMRKIYMGQIRR